MESLFDPQILRNIHAVLTWTMSSILLWISWDLSYLNYYCHCAMGNDFFGVKFLSFCEKYKEYFVTNSFFEFFFGVNNRILKKKSSQLPTRYMKRCKRFSIFIFFYVTKISLNILMHDHHLSNITKLKNKMKSLD
jgi:hypothetical protein